MANISPSDRREVITTLQRIVDRKRDITVGPPMAELLLQLLDAEPGEHVIHVRKGDNVLVRAQTTSDANPLHAVIAVQFPGCMGDHNVRLSAIQRAPHTLPEQADDVLIAIAMRGYGKRPRHSLRERLADAVGDLLTYLRDGTQQ